MSVESERDVQDSGTTVAMTTPPPTALRREAILPSDDRRRIGTMVAMCSLAGVGVGFGLSTAAMQAASEASRTMVVEQRSIEVVPAEASDVPWLGVRFRDARTEADGLSQGAAIDRVLRGTPAERAGFAPGDIVVQFEGHPVLSMEDFYRDVRMSDVGDEPRIDVVRNGQAVTLHPTLGVRHLR
jgi:S1-C subfamily serine protease